MVNDSSRQKWEVEPFAPAGKVRGVKRKGPQTKFSAITVSPIRKPLTSFMKFKSSPRKVWTDEAREILFRLREEGKTWGQIAEEMGTSRDSVRKEYKRCLKRLIEKN